MVMAVPQKSQSNNEMLSSGLVTLEQPMAWDSKVILLHIFSDLSISLVYLFAVFFIRAC